jgi:hypothetical protein
MNGHVAVKADLGMMLPGSRPARAVVLQLEQLETRLVTRGVMRTSVDCSYTEVSHGLGTAVFW